MARWLDTSDSTCLFQALPHHEVACLHKGLQDQVQAARVDSPSHALYDQLHFVYQNP